MKNTYFMKAKEVLENLHNNYRKNIKVMLMLAETYERLKMNIQVVALYKEMVQYGHGKDPEELRNILLEKISTENKENLPVS